MTQVSADSKRREPDEEAPPIFRTWKALYTLVITQLLLMIVAFYFFTKLFE